jgi:hypothetical protein
VWVSLPIWPVKPKTWLGLKFVPIWKGTSWTTDPDGMVTLAGREI